MRADTKDEILRLLKQNEANALGKLKISVDNKEDESEIDCLFKKWRIARHTYSSFVNAAEEEGEAFFNEDSPY